MYVYIFPPLLSGKPFLSLNWGRTLARPIYRKIDEIQFQWIEGTNVRSSVKRTELNK